MGTLDQEWAFTATCGCGWTGDVERHAYKNPLWTCESCKRLHNIVTVPDTVKYKKGDAGKKAELQELFGEQFAPKRR